MKKFILVFLFSFSFCFSQVNIELAQKTLNNLQAKYDYNLDKINVYIIKCYETIDNSDMDYELKQSIRNSFDINYVSKFRSKKYDLSYNSKTNEIIDWMQVGFLSIIKLEGKKYNRIKKREENEVLEFMGYHGGYNVPLINEYILEKNIYKLIKTETENNKIYYAGDAIWFKRGINSSWLVLELKFQHFNDMLNEYTYKTLYGDVFIDKSFKVITIVEDLQDGTTKKYEYVIGDYDPNIKPN